MVETKNGESYDGSLESCDNFMNLKLAEVIITSAVRVLLIAEWRVFKSEGSICERQLSEDDLA